MSTPVYAFVWDQSFINPQNDFIGLLDNGGIGRLSQNGLSFFNQLEALKDTRSASSRDISFVTNYTSSLMVDNLFFSDFTTSVDTLTSEQIGYIFAIIDAVFFKTQTSQADLETYLTTTAGIETLYVAQSLSYPNDTITDTVYPTGNTTGTPFSTYPSATLTLSLPTGTTSTQYQITFFVQNAYWINNYPESNIVGVSPPLSYNDLLTLPLNTTTANILSTASTTVGLNYTNFSPDLQSQSVSGYLKFDVKVIDSANNVTVIAPFLILYKGTTPTITQIRTAIKNDVINSGVGTIPEWKARIPELFILATVYLVPLYDVVTSLPNQALYPSLVEIQTAINRVDMVVPTLGLSYITQNLEIVSANYEGIMIGSIGLPLENGNVPKTILEMFPTYQNTGSQETNFQNMSTQAQQFSLMLSECLAVAFGNTRSTVYFPQTSDKITYVSFEAQQYEYCVITKTCYTNLLQKAGG